MHKLTVATLTSVVIASAFAVEAEILVTLGVEWFGGIFLGVIATMILGSDVSEFLQ